jgi:TPR repeat protein
MIKKLALLLTFTVCVLSCPAYADNAKGEEAYENGNYQVAFEEFTKAAENGDVNAQYNMGVMYEHGHGVEQSYLKAGEWYQRAADNGHPEAPTALQLLYEFF